MGQKVNPYGFRLGIRTEWKATWFFDREFKDVLIEDLQLRKLISGYCERQRISGVSNVEIRRKISTEVWITIHTGRPGLLIGRRGQGIEALRRELGQAVSKQVHINVEEVREFRIDAQLVAEGIAEQISRRAAPNRAMKRAVQEAMKAGAQGIMVKCSGRLGGREIARSETQRDGKLPLSTLRADIGYGFKEAKTAYGNIGVKVWLCRDDGKELALSKGRTTRPAEGETGSARPVATSEFSAPRGRGEAQSVASASEGTAGSAPTNTGVAEGRS